MQHSTTVSEALHGTVRKQKGDSWRAAVTARAQRGTQLKIRCQKK